MKFSIEHLNYELNQKQILKDISFEFSTGEFFTVIGPNGAGKTTLLKSLTKDLSFYSGNIFLGDKNLKDFNIAELATFRAVLSQANELNFSFTVEEVVLLGRSPHNSAWESNQDIEIVENAMKRTDILELKHCFYQNLSGGEQQRVQLARVLAQLHSDENQERFLFLDEPVSNLDMQHKILAMNIATQLKQQQTGVFCILHDLNLAAKYSDKIILMNQGEIHSIGTPSEIITENNIKDVFHIPCKISKHPDKDYLIIIF